MKKTILAMSLTLAISAGAATADQTTISENPKETISTQQGSSTSSIWVPLLLLAIIAAAVASD